MTLRDDLVALMGLPGLCGHEDRVRRWIRARLPRLESRTDRAGNLIYSFPGNGPRVMIFAHMDQLGFIVRKIEDNGLLRIHRVGGVPERALASQDVLICVGEGRDVPGVITNKSHHVTPPDEKYTVVSVADVFVDAGLGSREDAIAAGIRIGTPIVYAPRVMPSGGTRITGTSVDDRAGCAVLIALAEALGAGAAGPPVDIVFSVQEEFNLRGAVVAAQILRPDIAIQIDLLPATDTPDTAHLGEMALGQGPGMSLYSFHGRGTLNGVIPHPAMVDLLEDAATQAGRPLQRSAQTGILTDLSYVQTLGEGVASIDVGFPMRYSHSAREMCDLSDLESLLILLQTAIGLIGPDFSLERD